MRKSAARYSTLNRKLGLEPMAVLRIGQTPQQSIEDLGWLLMREVYEVRIIRPSCSKWVELLLYSLLMGRQFLKLTLQFKESQTHGLEGDVTLSVYESFGD